MSKCACSVNSLIGLGIDFHYLVYAQMCPGIDFSFSEWPVYLRIRECIVNVDLDTQDL